MSPGFGGSVRVLRDLVVSNGHVTDKQSYLVNIPSLPTYNGDDISIDTSGADVMDTLVVTTNTLGHVTAASATKRTLTLADLGYTGDTDAKNHQTAAELRAVIGTGNNNLVPAAGSAGQFLQHDGAFGTPPDNNTFRTVTAGGNTLSASETLAFTAGSNVTITESAGAVTIGSTNTTYSSGSGITLSGTTFTLTVQTTTSNFYYRIPFISNNAIAIDNTTSDFSFNPSNNALTVGKIGVGVTPFANSLSSSTNIDLVGNGGVLSYNNNLYLTSNVYYDNGWKAKTTGTTGMLIVRPDDLRYFVDTSSQSGGTTTSIVEVFTVSSSGNVVADGFFQGTNFQVSSDKRLKSEIKPIKEGLEVIKKFSSYNYIKGGKKESGFIAQEVKEVIPHTVYENEEGMLSMSDRGVLAHMHKAILELEERLTAIENKIK